jgi:tetratricopeptide (TPR) repeat protein
LSAFLLRQTVLATRPAADAPAAPASGAAADARELARREAFKTQFLAGVGLFEKERYSEALEAFERAAAAYPGLPDAHYYIGEVHRRLLFSDLADQAYRKALSFDARFWPARKSLAMLLYERGGYEESLRLLEAMRAEAPRDSFVMGETALNLMALGEAKRAAALLESYNAIEGRQAWGYAHLGRARALAGDAAGAEAAYREAIAIDPRHSLSRYWLGQLLAAGGRVEESRPHLDRYRELRALEDQEHQLQMALLGDAKSVGALVELARVRFALGRPKDSLKALERARELAPNDPKLAEIWEKVSKAAAGD